MSLSLQAAITKMPEVAGLPRPISDQQPEDVVRIVIEALAHTDKPYVDAGIATTFAFASPANKVNTGPLLEFTQMVKIRGMKGDETIFAFRLSQQIGGGHDAMWMTDAVWPVASGDIPEQAF